VLAVYLVAFVASVVVSVAGAAGAEPGQPALRVFNVNDGLASSQVSRIVSDSRGFLWFCTAGGLSRFDGRSFVTFGPLDGLKGQVILDIVEESDHATYWVGTRDGLFRFAGDRPASAGRSFERVELPIGGAVHRLLLDHAGRLWVGTSEGLVILERASDGRRPPRVVPLGGTRGERPTVFALLEDSEEAIWVGTHGDGVCRITPDLTETRCFPSTVAGLFFVRDLILGPDGRIWCTFLGGVARFHAKPATQSSPVAEIFDHRSGLPSIDTSALLADRSGEILVGTSAGVAGLRRDAEGTWSASPRWTTGNGLVSDLVQALALDPAGNLWIGSSSRGVTKLIRSGFRVYREMEERASIIVGVIHDDAGGVSALAAVEQRRYRLHRLTDTEHSAIDLGLPPGLTYLGWGAPRILRDRGGSWWVATGRGLLRYGGSGGVERLRFPPDGVFGPEQGLPGADIFAIFEDSHGGLWVSVSSPRTGQSSVALRREGEKIFTTLPPSLGKSPGDLASTFTEDRTGTVWIGFTSGVVARVGPDGPPERITFEPPLPDSWPLRRLVFDSRGRLWIGSRGAVVADDPRAVVVHTRPGPQALDDAVVSCALEDDLGRLYFGTDRGVLRFDEQRGKLRWYTSADGLPGDDIIVCERDARGDLWFGDVHGLARLSPGADLALAPPQVRIASVRADGVPLPVAPLGSPSVGPLALRSQPRHVGVQFFAVSHASGERIFFQHRFEGDTDWSAPSESGMLDIARLSPGRHRLSVRALTVEDAMAPPAVLELDVPAPIWRRPWFAALALAATLAAAFLAYRFRMAQVLALERVRTRIATDLHDEVGADLSRISLLAEIARRDLGDRPARVPEMLAEVAKTARNAVTDMSDIVWALKRETANLAEVVARVRDFAAESAAPAGVALRVVIDDDLEGVVLAGDVRRGLYLLLKEAVTNVLRHAEAHTMELTIRRSGRGGLVATLRDDGRGFSPDAPRKSRGGHGLSSMRARAEGLGAAFGIESAPGEGTTIRIELERA
jgi:signal transduction histidine kinase/ligand-binding sensor domain-containing protein